ELQSKRVRTKELLRREADAHAAKVLDAKQLAYKICMNSVYGFCGVSSAAGVLPCRAVASAVTAVGRSMLMRAKTYLEEDEEGRARFPGATVVYGDTDSLMVDFGVGDDVGECVRRGEEAARRITALFKSPVKLCFEKCYMPYILFSKKRYMGLIRSADGGPGTVDCKGVQFVRRDMCGFVKRMCADVVDVLMRQMDTEAAVARARTYVRRLLSPEEEDEEKTRLDDMVITKSIKHSAARILADVQKDCLSCAGRGTCRATPPGRRAQDALKCVACGAERDVAYKSIASPVVHVALEKQRRLPACAANSGVRAGDMVPFVYVSR
ncbi:MAG: DNA polymerase domain-containing protein, partial [Halobacteriaceae archaeon]